MAERYWIETLGCPKNQVDSDKLVGTLVLDGLVAAEAPEKADLVVVNTCAFIEAARQESIDTVLELSDLRRPGPGWWLPGAWPSGTAMNWPMPSPKWTWWHRSVRP